MQKGTGDKKIKKYWTKKKNWILHTDLWRKRVWIWKYIWIYELCNVWPGMRGIVNDSSLDFIASFSIQWMVTVCFLTEAVISWTSEVIHVCKMMTQFYFWWDILLFWKRLCHLKVRTFILKMLKTGVICHCWAWPVFMFSLHWLQ